MFKSQEYHKSTPELPEKFVVAFEIVFGYLSKNALVSSFTITLPSFLHKQKEWYQLPGLVIHRGFVLLHYAVR